MTNLPPDPVVRRVNELVTTFLDVLGILLAALAVGWFGWTAMHPASGLAAAGLTVTALSAIAQRRMVPKPSKASEEGDEEGLPGPAHRGNLHVMGR
jgi:hypothetical protein